MFSEARVAKPSTDRATFDHRVPASYYCRVGLMAEVFPIKAEDFQR